MPGLTWSHQAAWPAASASTQLMQTHREPAPQRAHSDPLPLLKRSPRSQALGARVTGLLFNPGGQCNPGHCSSPVRTTCSPSGQVGLLFYSRPVLGTPTSAQGRDTKPQEPQDKARGTVLQIPGGEAFQGPFLLTSGAADGKGVPFLPVQPLQTPASSQACGTGRCLPRMSFSFPALEALGAETQRGAGMAVKPRLRPPDRHRGFVSAQWKPNCWC